jgi:hypothetical protein
MGLPNLSPSCADIFLKNTSSPVRGFLRFQSHGGALYDVDTSDFHVLSTEIIIINLYNANYAIHKP